MRWLLCASVVAVLSGCQAHYLDIDGQIVQRAAQPIDALPPIQQAPEPLPQPRPLEKEKMLPSTVHDDLPATGLDLALTATQKEGMQPDKKPRNMLDRLQFPDTIIGKIPDIRLPTTAPAKDIAAAIKKQFPELPKVPRLPEPKPGPEGRPMTLADLQMIAQRLSPQIRQAHLDIEAARGLALQAGLYPNPAIGYEAGTIGQGDPNGQRTPGQQGGFVEQTVVTMGKLTLARNAATRDIEIAEQRLKATEADVQALVRAGYFAVLTARETYRVTRAMTELTDELYNVLLLQLSVGEVAPYEPMQIRVLATQSRGTLVQAHNRYVAAWKQLAATLGTPGMPLTAIEGKIDMPVPHFEHDKVLAYVLANHTDMISAQFGVERNRFLTRLAEVQPYPDVTVHVAFQKDFTTPPFGTVANVNVGVPFPLWNRNQGSIQAARANLRRALEDSARVQNDLTIRTADAFERYENNRVLLILYKEQILPSQVKAFRAALARHNVEREGKVSYYDVVTSQQTLAGLINSYLGALGDQWTAVVDIAHLTQTQDLFQMQKADEVAPVPDVPEMLPGALLQRGR
jgi:cobalt-zinc-cadmium efflux system outer membrane protein